MICGAVGRYHTHLRHVSQVIGKLDGVSAFATVSALVLPNGPLFIADTYVSYDPVPERLAEITLLAAEEVRRFGLEPKVALVSHSNFGSEDTPSARKMRERACNSQSEVSPVSRSTARCMLMRRCHPSSARKFSRTRD